MTTFILGEIMFFIGYSFDQHSMVKPLYILGIVNITLGASSIMLNYLNGNKK